MSKPKTGRKAKSGPVHIVVQGKAAIVAAAKKGIALCANARSNMCLAIAKVIAKNNPDIKPTDYRQAKADFTAMLRDDKALVKLAVDNFGMNNWRGYCNLIGQASVAMIEFPSKEYASLRSNTAKSAKCGSAATAGQCLINKDGKPDKRAGNASKPKAGKPKGSVKLRGDKAGEHPMVADERVIECRRFGDAFLEVGRVVGRINSMLADEVAPEPAEMLAALNDISKRMSTASKEWDKLREAGSGKYDLQTGSPTKVSSVI